MVSGLSSIPPESGTADATLAKNRHILTLNGLNVELDLQLIFIALRGAVIRRADARTPKRLLVVELDRSC